MKSVRRSILAAAALLAAMVTSASAQDLEAKRDKMLKSPFLKKAAWITDYDKALQESSKSGKLIFAYFTRSYST